MKFNVMITIGYTTEAENIIAAQMEVKERLKNNEYTIYNIDADLVEEEN